jgi:hypothetical protein
MNLYFLHSNLASLLHHEAAHESIPELFWYDYIFDIHDLDWLKKREGALLRIQSLHTYTQVLRSKHHSQKAKLRLQRPQLIQKSMQKKVLHAVP